MAKEKFSGWPSRLYAWPSRLYGGWQTKFNVSPGPGLWPLVLGPFGPDLGPGPGPELDKIS